MRDIKSIHAVQLLHPKIRDEVKLLIEKAEDFFPASIAIRIAQGLRTIDEQNGLYAKGRTKPGNKVTNAKGGQSYHNYGLAIDFCLLYDKDGNGTYEVASWDVSADFDKDHIPDWREVVDVFEKAGYTWGGRWAKIVDAPHLEKTFSHHWSDLLIKYNNKNFIPGTQYVNI
jgi:peptidoglycan L-alanyl-D-glutamate endopeptidase CwlK